MNLLKIIVIILIIFSYSCKEESACIDPQVGRTLLIRNMNYLPRTGVLYYYDRVNNDFCKLIKEEKLLFIKKDDDNVNLFSKDTDNKHLKYNYRLIVDDTLCFDLSDFQTKPDTMGRTMGGWAVRCQLTSYKCNDSIYNTGSYQSLDPPFESRRIIKKGQYDQ